MGKARFGGIRSVATPQARTRQAANEACSLTEVEGHSGIVVAAANVHDTKLLAMTLESVVVERPGGGDAEVQHLCLDKG